MTSLRAVATSSSELISSFKIVGGFARVNPVPLTSQPARSKALTTCLPSRPVAPVMRAVFAMVVMLLVGSEAFFKLMLFFFFFK